MYIPVSTAKQIADECGCDQVIIIARKLNRNNDQSHYDEHIATYGVNTLHCEVASSLGDFIKYKVMGWDKESN